MSVKVMSFEVFAETQRNGRLHSTARLRKGDTHFYNDIADLIERQAKALEDAEKALAYARRFLRSEDHDVAFVDTALANIRAAKGGG